MPFLNPKTQEVNYKLVYYGPPLAGKSTNLLYIFNQTEPQRRGLGPNVDPETEKILSLDVCPNLSVIPGEHQVHLHLYCETGIEYKENWRIPLLKKVDGIVFVADSHPLRLESNLSRLDMLEADLWEHYGRRLKEIPYTLQFNKRDFPGIVPFLELKAILQRYDEPIIEAIAKKGQGVIETLTSITMQMIENFNKDLG